MNKIFKIAAAAVLAGSFVLPAFSSARAEERDQDYVTTHKYVERTSPARSQDQFLDSHPDIRRDPSSNPRLADNRDYLRNHPGLESYMRQHPNLRHEWREHPRVTMRHQERWESKHDRDDRN